MGVSTRAGFVVSLCLVGAILGAACVDLPGGSVSYSVRVVPAEGNVSVVAPLVLDGSDVAPVMSEEPRFKTGDTNYSIVTTSRGKGLEIVTDEEVWLKFEKNHRDEGSLFSRETSLSLGELEEDAVIHNPPDGPVGEGWVKSVGRAWFYVDPSGGGVESVEVEFHINTGTNLFIYSMRGTDLGSGWSEQIVKEEVPFVD